MKQRKEQKKKNTRKWLSKLPNISQTPPVAAGEGFLTETEKKTNNREKGRGGG